MGCENVILAVNDREGNYISRIRAIYKAVVVARSRRFVIDKTSDAIVARTDSGNFISADSGSTEQNCGGLIATSYKDLSFLEKGFTEDNIVKAMDVLYSKEDNRDLPFQQMYIIALREVERLKEKK